jgi:iron complex transport system substrate-binding protein
MSSFNGWRRCVLPVAIAAVLAGCGSSASKSSSTTTQKPAPAPAPAKASNGVPMPSYPKRIVSLSASSTEDLYAVSAGSQVVAVDQYSTYPANAPRTKLSGYQPNVEAIAKYNPDLVVTYENVNHVSQQLAALHIPVLIEAPPSNLSGAYAQLTQLGNVTGHPHDAARVVAGVRAQVAAILASMPKSKRALSVYHELDQTYYSASSHTFVGQIYALLGLRNIADEAAKASVYPQLSSEYIISANPSLIVLADSVCCHQSIHTVAKRAGWSGVAAVRSGAVLSVNDSIASEWGPRIVLFLRTIADEVRKLERGK